MAEEQGHKVLPYTVKTPQTGKYTRKKLTQGGRRH